jgi:hypothetical protein
MSKPTTLSPNSENMRDECGTYGAGRRQVASYLDAAGFRLRSMQFGPRDAFTYVVVVADKV